MLLYNLLLTLATGPARWWLGRHPRHHVLLQRFAPAIPPVGQAPLWIQACSLGEVNTIRPLVAALREQWPDTPILITTSTHTGYERAQALFGASAVTWFPFDTRRAIRPFLDAVAPKALLLAETELWPNVVAECRRRDIPVLVVNGRLGEAHLKKYQRYRWWYRPLVRQLTAAAMQSEVHAERMRALGARPESVRVTGNLKFDAVRAHVSSHTRQRIRMACGLKREDRLLVFGSTRPGDEALASACWATLREEYPDLRLVIAPRHIERAEEITGYFSEPVRRRSESDRALETGACRVLILDTTGELVNFLSVASVAVVGGSFYPGVNGHNPLEAAALGVPVVFGSYMGNFEDAASTLVSRSGARQVACPEDLYFALSELLGDGAARRQMGTLARKAVLDNQGAVGHTVALTEEIVFRRQPEGG